MWLGLARRRTLVLPTWKGWLLLVGAVAGCTFLLLRGAYPYLAAESRLPKADVVLIEGWVSDDAVAQAKRELEAGRCDLICTAGVDLDKGSHLLEWKDWATLAAETLKAMGVPEDKILSAPGGAIRRHRTYVGFEKAREKLATLNKTPIRINVITEGPHGRRSITVARKVFGDTATIGVISVEPSSYEPKHWWTTSNGLKGVFMELVGSSYERFADSGR